MSAYYNEIEAYPSQWLRNLVAAGHIAPGEVDPRSIVDVTSVTATQAHFFAGIGIWSSALRAASWPDDCEAWTGSCPCQPFSTAGKKKGTADVRHLWPEWFRLITAHRPPIIFGEQVSSKGALAWLDNVFTDLEGIGYTCRAISANAASVGGPHTRQRLYFVAYTDSERFQRVRTQLQQRGPLAPRVEATGGSVVSNVEHTDETRCSEYQPEPDVSPQPDVTRTSVVSNLGHTDGKRARGDSSSSSGTEATRDHGRFTARVIGHSTSASGATRGFWAGAEWIRCTDGKARAIEPGTFPLVDGYPSRVAELRAYGNAIVRSHAQTFIEAVIEAICE